MEAFRLREVYGTPGRNLRTFSACQQLSRSGSGRNCAPGSVGFLIGTSGRRFRPDLREELADESAPAKSEGGLAAAPVFHSYRR
jgi:hypothetical protein